MLKIKSLLKSDAIDWAFKGPNMKIIALKKCRNNFKVACELKIAILLKKIILEFVKSPMFPL